MAQFFLARTLKERVGFGKVVTTALQELRQDMCSVSKMNDMVDLAKPPFDRRGYPTGPSGDNMIPPHHEEDATVRQHEGPHSGTSG